MMNKKGVLPLGIILVVAFFFCAFYFGWFSSSSIVSGRGITNEIKTEVWNGYNVELQAAYWGSLTSKDSTKRYEYTESGGRKSIWTHYDFCNDNDGEHSINNEYSISGDLKLSSGMRGSEACDQENYINAKITLPRGTIKVVCNLKAGDRYGMGWAMCEVGGISKKVVSKNKEGDHIYRGELSENFEVVLEEEKEIEINLKTTADGRQSFSNAEVVLSFEKYQEPTITTPKPTTTTQNNSPATTQSSGQSSNFITKFFKWIFSWFHE